MKTKTVKTKSYYYLFVTFIFIILFQNVQANHILGGDLTYVNVSSNTYKFYLTVYRDCSGNLLDPVYTLNYKSSTCNTTNQTFTVTKVGNPIEVSVSCPSSPNTCNGGSSLGIQKQIYTGTITLPQACTDWVISWDPGANSKRSSTITNIQNPSAQNFYLEAKINNSSISNNNSPSFSGMAFSYLFVNSQGNISPNAIDKDGDQIRYSLVTPKTSATTTITYTKPSFTATSPITVNGTATFNTSTGVLSMKPTLAEQSATAIVVEEYRNGVLIGSVMRDMQIISIDNANNNPTLSGINNTSSDSIQVCAGDAVNFNLYGSDIDINTQNLTATWDNGISLLNNNFDGFTQKGTKGKDTINFKWKTPISSSGLFQMTVTLSDNNCPLIGTDVKTYKIRVYPKPVFNLANDTTINCSDTKLLLAYNLKGTSPYVYNWNNGAKTSSVNVSPGFYKLTITDKNSCSYSDSINIKSGIVAKFTIDSLCAGSTSTFSDFSFSKSGSTITSWKWDFGDPSTGINDSSTLKNPSHIFSNEGSFNVKLTATDNLGCKGDTIIKYHFCSKPKPDFEIKDTCKRNPAVLFDLTEVNGCGIKNYFFTFENLNTHKLEFSNYDYPPNPSYLPGQPRRDYLSKWLPADSGNYKITMVAVNENNCRSSIVKQVHIRPQPIVHLKEKSYILKCNNPDSILQILDTLTIKTKNHPGFNGWLPLKLTWSKDGVPTALDSLKKHISGAGIYSVTVTDMYGCDSVETVEVKNKTFASIRNYPYCHQGDSIKFIDRSISSWNIVKREWFFGDGQIAITGGSDTSKLNISHFYNTDGNYKVFYKVTDEYDCNDTISLNILINTIINTFSVNPNPVCVGNPITLNSQSGKLIDTLYINYGDGNTAKINSSAFINQNTIPIYTNNHTYTQFGAGKYLLKVQMLYNQQRCFITDTQTVRLFPELKINIADPIGLCVNAPTTINATRISGNPITQWNWTITKAASTFPFTKDTLLLDSTVVSNVINKTIDSRTKTFTTGGNYFLDLQVNNTDGCKFEVNQKKFGIIAIPPITYCVNQLCAATPSLFTLYCPNKPEVTLNKFTWEFGDGITSSLPDSVLHTYMSLNDSIYKLKISVADTNNHCSRDSIFNIPVKSVAFPAFSADTVCLQNLTNFTDKSIVLPGDTIYKWHWQFGDGDTSNLENPKHLYKAPGTYNTNLSVINKGKNCTKNYTGPVIVRNLPTANFGFDSYSASAQKPVLFTDSSSIDVTGWFYTFGDGNTSNIQNPANIYKKAGIYTVTQTVTNSYGCSDNISKLIDLNIYFFFPTGFSPNGDNMNDKFHPIMRGIESIEEIKLYNRWGELIWESSGDMNAAWDGKYKGEDQPAGVYVYYARAKSFLGDDVKIEGKVTIIR